jgi:hypothetical protein
MELLQAIGPAVIAIAVPLVTAAVGYYFGRRAKIDEARIAKAFEVGEEVGRLFLRVSGIEAYLHQFFEINFSKPSGGLSLTLEETIDILERREAQYGEQYAALKELGEKRSELIDALSRSHLYLDHKTVARIEEYLDLGEFRFTTDGGIMTNTWLLEFFRNLMDPAKAAKRGKLYKSIRRRFQRLVN